MPGLVPVIESLDKVAEPLRPFYEQKDGKFHLILDGTPAGFAPAAELAAANGKVVEFRDNNIKLTQEVEKARPILAKLGTADPEKAVAALAKVEELEKKGVTKPDDIAVQINAAVAAAIKPLQEAATTNAEALKAERARADAAALSATIGGAFTKVGGQAGATDFIVGKAKDVFTVQDGKIVALPNKFSPSNPAQPLTVEEWLTLQTKENAFAFAPTTGGGAQPLTSTGATVNPNQTVLKDPTPNQLGENSKAIAEGKVRVEYTQQTGA